jgi:hypothetical protein
MRCPLTILRILLVLSAAANVAGTYATLPCANVTVGGAVPLPPPSTSFGAAHGWLLENCTITKSVQFQLFALSKLTIEGCNVAGQAVSITFTGPPSSPTTLKDATISITNTTAAVASLAARLDVFSVAASTIVNVSIDVRQSYLSAVATSGPATALTITNAATVTNYSLTVSDGSTLMATGYAAASCSDAMPLTAGVATVVTTSSLNATNVTLNVTGSPVLSAKTTQGCFAYAVSVGGSKYSSGGTVTCTNCALTLSNGGATAVSVGTGGCCAYLSAIGGDNAATQATSCALHVWGNHLLRAIRTRGLPVYV